MMSTTRQDDRHAAEPHSGEGSASNPCGTATGPGSSYARGDEQRTIAGSGSETTTHNRPGHKTHG